MYSINSVHWISLLFTSANSLTGHRAAKQSAITEMPSPIHKIKTSKRLTRNFCHLWNFDRTRSSILLRRSHTPTSIDSVITTLSSESNRSASSSLKVRFLEYLGHWLESLDGKIQLFSKNISSLSEYILRGRVSRPIEIHVTVHRNISTRNDFDSPPLGAHYYMLSSNPFSDRDSREHIEPTATTTPTISSSSSLSSLSFATFASDSSVDESECCSWASKASTLFKFLPEPGTLVSSDFDWEQFEKSLAYYEQDYEAQHRNHDEQVPFYASSIMDGTLDGEGVSEGEGDEKSSVSPAIHDQ
jgi:hypothetical protein